MKLDFKGKTAVITGASGGMGLEISKKLSQNNISVLMLDLKMVELGLLLRLSEIWVIWRQWVLI